MCNLRYRLVTAPWFQSLRALALSNILRGFSFLPGCEQLLCAHNGLLFVLGRFLQLMVSETPVQRAKPVPKMDVVRSAVLLGLALFIFFSLYSYSRWILIKWLNSVHGFCLQDAPLPEPESYDAVRNRALSLLDCDDSQEVLLVETANQLRDDAFVMLCHMSVAVGVMTFSASWLTM